MTLAPALLLTAVAVPLGCAGPAEDYERPVISSALQEQTGYTLGPDSAPGETRIPDGVTVEDGISETEAVALALWNNAAFQEAIAGLGLQRADLVQAGLLTNPVLSLLFPVGPKQLEFTVTFPLEAIWLRGQRLAAAELDCERVATLLVEHGLDLIRDVKVAYAALQLARERRTLASERAEVAARSATLEDARLRAGDTSELEVALARVKALGARTQAARLSRAEALAEGQLCGLVGWTEDQAPLRFEPSGRVSLSEAPELAALIGEALAARPELRASELRLEAAGKRAGLARWDFLRLSALLDANGDGTEGFEIGPGINLPLPIFDQGQGVRAKAAAELEIAARHYVTVRERIVLDVRQAYTRYLDASEGIETIRGEIVPVLEAALEQETRAFETGATSPLTVLEGRDRLLAARLEEAQLAGDVATALAELERHVGRTLPRDAEVPTATTAGIHHVPTD